MSATVLQPRQWQGESIEGKSLLVSAGENPARTIQLSRYLSYLTPYKASINFCCSPELMTLMQTAFEFLTLHSQLDEVPSCDYQITLSALCDFFRSDSSKIPSRVPYLVLDDHACDYWQKYFANQQKFKIGLLWTGQDTQAQCPLTSLKPLFHIKGIQYYSLQFGDVARNLIELNEQGYHIIDLASRLNELSSAAACMANLDLIICVDGIYANLAAATACPVWLLQTQSGSSTVSEKSRWYPTMQVFSLPQSDDWHALIKDVSMALQRMLLA